MRFADLGLKMGDIMQLQISADSEVRHPVKLLGFLPDTSIIISVPKDAHGRVIFMKQDQLVTLRFVVNNVASGFTAKVLKMNTQPDTYLHLQMPQQVEAIEVRNAVRVATEISATIINETHQSQPISVTVSNLSVLGGKIDSERKIALIGDKLSLTMTLLLDEVEKLVTLECYVRNKGKSSDEEGGANWYGFYFEFSDDEDRLLLKAYVYQEILRSLHLL